MVEQFLHLKEQAAQIGRRLATVVFMGMGEPLLNLANVLRAVRHITGQRLGGLGGKQVAISTVGIVPGIDELANAQLKVNLAISLHAADDATRARLVPSTRRWGVADIVAAAKRFQQKTRRMVMVEYCLLDGINDSEADARALAELLGGFRVHVNVIPYNPIGAGKSGAVYRAPSPYAVQNFLRVLRVQGILARGRRARGTDVSAACGQLRESAVRGGSKL
jgi:23S rRNA (adenine2503-C2)-methyltransferase